MCCRCFKCCQYCLESIYWHCIEKHFCYDESIALYEEEEIKEEKEEKNNNAYDNLAFYDSVAIIANRSIFCIEPLPEKTQVITEQPRKKLKWWEADEGNETPIRSILLNPPMTKEDSISKECGNPKEESDVDTSDKNVLKKTKFVVPEIKESSDCNDSSTPPILETIKEENGNTSPPLKKAVSHLALSAAVKLRKKSLHERRMSRSLTLPIDKLEIPIIRQNSFPKFYLDTPEQNQTDSSIMQTPIQAFETPKLPNSQFKFDLRSVVQMAMEAKLQQQQLQQQQSEQATPSTKEKSYSFKEKLRPLKLLKNASTNSLYKNS